MLHHLEHRHHQEEDIDLSKQTRITALQAALKRASGFPRRCGSGREIVRWGGKKKRKEKTREGKNSIPESAKCRKSKRKVHQFQNTREIKHQGPQGTRVLTNNRVNDCFTDELLK